MSAAERTDPAGGGRADPAGGRAGAVGPAVPRLGVWEWLFLAVLSLLLLAVGSLGAVVSFSNVRSAMGPSFGGWAWAVPIGVDIGIALFTGWDLLLSRLAMRPVWLRFVPWSLVAATIYLNVEPSLAGGDVPGAVGHAVLPGIWVLAVELAAGLVRHRAGLTQPGVGRRQRRPERLDRVRLSRWLLAPVSTAQIWRHMRLAEEPSYRAALDTWRARRLARCDLADRNGGPPRWRWQTPRRARIEYRLGHLTPATTVAEPATDDVAVADRQPLPAAGNLPAGTTGNRQTPETGKRQAAEPGNRQTSIGNGNRQAKIGAGFAGGGSTGRVGRAGLGDVAGVVADLEAEGVRVSRTTVTDRLRRQRGLSCSNQRAEELLAQLRDGQHLGAGAAVGGGGRG